MRRFLTAGLSLLTLLVACGGSKPAPIAAAVSAKCPDVTKADEIAAFDFVKEYGVSREAGDKLKAASLAAIEVATLAERLDADLGILCTQMAHELGNQGDWRSGDEACAASIKALQETREKLGPKAMIGFVQRESVCVFDPSELTKCASLCDSAIPAGKAQATCPKEVGRCDGDCDGICVRGSKTGSKCEGRCNGACEGPLKGLCGGRCTGTCDGKPSRGPCHGVCVGSCDRGIVDGDCKGLCSGTCQRSKPGICDGQCVGACTVELSETRCAERPKSPSISAACGLRCDLLVYNHTECSMPEVGFVVTGAKDRVAADALKLVVDRSFPSLLKLLAELGEESQRRVPAAQALLDKTQANFGTFAAKSDSAAPTSTTEKHLAKCFGEHLKAGAASAKAATTAIQQAQSIQWTALLSGEEAARRAAPAP